MPRQRAGKPSVVLVGAAGPEVLRAGHLVAVVEIVDDVEDGVLVVDVDDGAVGEDGLMPASKTAHSSDPWKSSTIRKPPRRRYSRRAGLLLAPLPVADLDRVEPGPIELIAVLDVDGLLDGAAVDAGEAPHREHEMALGARVVGGPAGVALAPVAVAAPEAAATAEASIAAGERRIHQAGEHPFGGLAPVRRQREVFILAAGVLAERFLGEEETGEEEQTASEDPSGMPREHRAPLS